MFNFGKSIFLLIVVNSGEDDFWVLILKSYGMIGLLEIIKI